VNGGLRVNRIAVTVRQLRRCVQSGGWREPTAGSEDRNGPRAERSERPVHCLQPAEADSYGRRARTRLAEWEKASCNRYLAERAVPWYGVRLPPVSGPATHPDLPEAEADEPV
jgi:formylglycine-generating enzyme required for sulfatase activity